MFQPGDIVKRVDIKGRKEYVVIRVSPDFVYCSVLGGGARGLEAMLPFMLKKIGKR